MASQMKRGWQVGKTLKECHKHMLEDHVASDVIFLLKSKENTSVQVPAHKCMLVCRSPVFEAMLCGDFKEASNEVSITDIELEIFKEVLGYIYYDEVTLSEHNVMHMMFAAKKYILQDLEGRCKKYMEDTMCSSNVCTILNHSVFYEELELVNKCVKFIIDNTEETFDSEDFLNLKHEELCKILGNDRINRPEIKIMNSCIKWANFQQTNNPDYAACSIRDILGKCVFQIRFLSMTNEELVGEEVSEILSKDEQLSLIRCAIRQNKQPAKDIEQFNLNRRLPNMIATNIRFRTIVNPDAEAAPTPNGFQRLPQNSQGECLSFSVDKPLCFMGVSVFAGAKIGDRHSATLKFEKVKSLYGGYEEPIYQAMAFAPNDQSSSSNCQTTSSVIISDGSNKPVSMLLDKAIPLIAGTTYKVSVTWDGPAAYYGTNQINTLLAGDTKVSISLCASDRFGFMQTKGQIPHLFFCKNN